MTLVKMPVFNEPDARFGVRPKTAQEYKLNDFTVSNNYFLFAAKLAYSKIVTKQEVEKC